MRKHQSLYLVVALILLVAITLEVRATQNKFDQPQLSKLAAQILQDDVLVDRPSFKTKDGTLYYFLGEVILPDPIPVTQNESISSSDPIGIPLRSQARIELLKQYINKLGNNDWLFLMQQIQVAERVISPSLADIYSPNPPKHLLDKLKRDAIKIDEIIDQGVQDYARQKQLNLYKTKRKVQAAEYKITFSSTPPGGIISYVLELPLKEAKRKGLDPPWRVAVQTDAIPLKAGTYWIHVQWPEPTQTGGITESEYPVEILANGNLDLKPIPKTP